MRSQKRLLWNKRPVCSALWSRSSVICSIGVFFLVFRMPNLDRTKKNLQLPVTSKVNILLLHCLHRHVIITQVGEAEIPITPPTLASVDCSAAKAYVVLCFLKAKKLALWQHSIPKYLQTFILLLLVLEFKWEYLIVDFAFGASCGLYQMWKLCACALLPPHPICFFQARLCYFLPFFTLVKTYQSKPSLCFAFALNPCSACYYNTLHLTIQ